MKQKLQKEKKETAKNESNLGFKWEMLGKFVSKKQANINKGKGNKKKKDRRHPKIYFSKQDWSQRVRGGEPEGVRKHLPSKKVLLYSKKVVRRTKGF